MRLKKKIKSLHKRILLMKIDKIITFLRINNFINSRAGSKKILINRNIK